MDPLAQPWILGCWRSMKPRHYQPGGSYLRLSSEWQPKLWSMPGAEMLVVLVQQAPGLAAHQAHAWGSMIQTWRGGVDGDELAGFPAIDYAKRQQNCNCLIQDHY